MESARLVILAGSFIRHRISTSRHAALQLIIISGAMPHQWPFAISMQQFLEHLHVRVCIYHPAVASRPAKVSRTSTWIVSSSVVFYHQHTVPIPIVGIIIAAGLGHAPAEYCLAHHQACRVHQYCHRHLGVVAEPARVRTTPVVYSGAARRPSFRQRICHVIIYSRHAHQRSIIGMAALSMFMAHLRHSSLRQTLRRSGVVNKSIQVKCFDATAFARAEPGAAA